MKGVCWKFIGKRVLRGLNTDKIDHLLALLDIHFGHPSIEMIQPDIIGKNKVQEKINSISELLESRIKLKVVVSETIIMDITFHNRALTIPRLTISDYTKALSRNLETYENSLPKGDQTIVSKYMFFITILVRTQDDV
ncbi:hypothetical protein BUALT_Bualt14G0050600 [Buddleja alternifolia]|uniref:Uncharacterized protein n=1 Tax=Buddleja alternifolia TaxID=168488 RepID=A0AAV6WGR1_9LAMI|nr:hypothetical protein BUALT_Bualt14G0050600 [Buddleja alternifolia]